MFRDRVHEQEGRRQITLLPPVSDVLFSHGQRPRRRDQGHSVSPGKDRQNGVKVMARVSNVGRRTKFLI